MQIICFFGPDGSGKTSLARRTALTLAKRGYKVRTSGMRGTHTLSFALGRILRRFEVFKSSNPKRITVPAKLRPVWSFLEFTSLMPVLIERFVLPDLLGFWVVGDRYTPDFIV